MTKNTYGTGSFVLTNSGPTLPAPVDGLLTTIAWSLAPGAVTYAMEGAIFVTGAAVQWLRDGLGIIAEASEVGPLAASVPDSGGVYVVPAFPGLGSPWWDPYARGTIVGITRGHDQGAHRPRRRGGDGVPDRRRGRRDRARQRHRAHRGDARRRRCVGDGRPVPVPGRRARRHRAPRPRSRRPRRSARPSWRAWPRESGTRRPRSTPGGAPTRRSHPRWMATNASGALRPGTARSNGRATGRRKS